MLRVIPACASRFSVRSRSSDVLISARNRPSESVIAVVIVDLAEAPSGFRCGGTRLLPLDQLVLVSTHPFSPPSRDDPDVHQDIIIKIYRGYI